MSGWCCGWAGSWPSTSPKGGPSAVSFGAWPRKKSFFGFAKNGPLARRRQLLILSGKQEVAIDGDEGFGLTIDDYLSLLPDQAWVYVCQEWLQISLPGGRRSFSAANYRQLLWRALKEFAHRFWETGPG